jgi:hypothetical protein
MSREVSDQAESYKPILHGVILNSPLAEARGVVVPERARVTERLEDGITLQDQLLHAGH